MKNGYKLKKVLIKIASRLFPKGVTSFAYNQLSNPQVRKLRNNELAILERAEMEKYRYKEFDIRLYTWKGGEREVLLIHGWEGQAGNFSDLIEELVITGFTVHAFDAPSHGFSSKGSTSLFEFSELVGELIERYRVRNLISHSFGGVAVTYALYNREELTIDTYILLTTPDKFTERIDDVSEMVGIGKNVKNLLKAKLRKETGLDPDMLNVSEFVKQINVERSLIIHDRGDKVIPISRSRNVLRNWSCSEFLEVEGTGHFRILRTKRVIDSVIDFLG